MQILADERNSCPCKASQTMEVKADRCQMSEDVALEGACADARCCTFATSPCARSPVSFSLGVAEQYSQCTFALSSLETS